MSDDLWLEPTPGHTPGHVSVWLSSGEGEAVITGDLMHHPVQVAAPGWGSHFDSDVEQARKTRRVFCERYADGPIAALGIHFNHPTTGRILRHDDAWRFVVPARCGVAPHPAGTHLARRRRPHTPDPSLV